MGELAGGMQNVVMAGFSQGGTLALDAAFYNLERGPGALVVLGASTYDNSPSLTQEKIGSFEGTKVSLVGGKLDIWFPPEPTKKRMLQLQQKLKFKFNDPPLLLDIDHTLFDSGEQFTDKIIHLLQ